MRIFLIWLAIIACGVANGYFFSSFGHPENLVFLLCSSIVCAIVLLVHRRITKHWRVPLDPWAEGFHFPVFRLSLFFSVFALIMLFIMREINSFVIVTCVTVALASFVAYMRETRYTDDWI